MPSIEPGVSKPAITLTVTEYDEDDLKPTLKYVYTSPNQTADSSKAFEPASDEPTVIKQRTVMFEYSCGHSEPYTTYWKWKGAKRAMEEACNRMCPYCTIAKYQGKDGFIKLIGTDRQIAWGLGIRNQLKEDLEQFKQSEEYADFTEEEKQQLEKTIDKWFSTELATTWITERKKRAVKYFKKQVTVDAAVDWLNDDSHNSLQQLMELDL